MYLLALFRQPVIGITITILFTLMKFVYGVKDHQGLLDLIGEERMEMIKADPRTGYAANLDRR